MKFDEIMKAIHIEGVIGTGLIVALFLAIYFGDKDLAVNIASFLSRTYGGKPTNQR